MALNTIPTEPRLPVTVVALVTIAIPAFLMLVGGDSVDAQHDRGAVSNLRLTSPNAGVLVIAWDAPDEAPTDYRVTWAPSGEGFPSYKDANTSTKGNAYPSTAAHTVSGLAAGGEYQARVRARYRDGEHADAPWSGPWSGVATVTISSPPQPTPTPQPTPEPTPEPTPSATPEPTPQPQRGEVTGLALSSDIPGSLTVSWNAPSDAPDSYRVVWAEQSLDFPSYKEDNQGDRGNEYPGGDSISVALTGLTKGATFKVMARARYDLGGSDNGSWSGPWTDTVTARVKSDPPAAPVGLTTSSVEPDRVTLTWTAPRRGDVTGYRLLRGTGADPLAVIVANTGNAGVRYTDATVAAETTYAYAVSALGPDGEGARSATVNFTTPADQRGVVNEVVLTSNRVRTLDISWRAARPVPTDYQVSWAKVGADYLPSTDLGGNAYVSGASHRLSNLEHKTAYKVRVKTRYTAGEYASDPWNGPWSEEETLVTVSQASRPAGLTTLPGNSGVLLEWSDPQDASITGYRILRNTGGRYFDTLVADTGTADHWYLDGSAQHGTHYVYAVKAINPLGESEPSQRILAIMPSQPVPASVELVGRDGPLRPASQQNSQNVPGKPAGVTATAGDNGVSVRWDDPGDDTITGYSVVRYEQHGAHVYETSMLSENTGSPGTAYQDTSATRDVLYYQYRMYAINQTGASAASDWSNQVSLQGGDDGAPDRPQGLDVFSSDNRVVLLWDPPHDSGPTGHRIMRGSGPTNLEVLVGNTKDTGSRYTDRSVSDDTDYVYAIEAINPAGKSPRSAAVKTVTPRSPRENTLVSNLAPSAAGPAIYRTDIIQPGGVSFHRFKTGDNAKGYNLLGVVVNVSKAAVYPPENPNNPTVFFPNVSIWSVAGFAEPGALQHNLTPPSEPAGRSIARGFEFYSAPDGTTLNANTQYFVAIHSDNGHVYRTGSNATWSVNNGAAPGWAISRGSLYFPRIPKTSMVEEC